MLSSDASERISEISLDTLSFLQEKEIQIQGILSQRTKSQESVSALKNHIEAKYEKKLTRYQEQNSTSEESLQTLRGLLEKYSCENEELSSAQKDLESLLTRLQSEKETKRTEAQVLVSRKDSLGSDKLENHPSLRLLKARSLLYQLSGFAWHNRKLKGYYISPGRDDGLVKMFNFEGGGDAGEDLWEAMSLNLSSTWKAKLTTN
eukprot:TRINITY_DN5104_c0_g1_i1.p1 TRINITY_DN5104_c0_g1~~TRINITY_DN5104_c0_g1_i1.p1  ORF type:complete len:205 (+),score=72.90 TRINITY_DN5104_c0_g1_i1:99-713(+)